MENFSGISRVGSDWSLRTATSTGRVFTGNQYVKTMSLSKLGRAFGIAGGAAGMIYDSAGLYNYAAKNNSKNSVSPGKFAVDGIMTVAGIWGGPAGAAISTL